MFRAVNRLKTTPIGSVYPQSLHVSINLQAETPSGLEFRAETNKTEAHTGRNGRLGLNMGPFFAFRTTCCVFFFTFTNAY
jgi:hypothetical protein